MNILEYSQEMNIHPNCRKKCKSHSGHESTNAEMNMLLEYSFLTAEIKYSAEKNTLMAF
jgi:hypothetical protein